MPVFMCREGRNGFLLNFILTVAMKRKETRKCCSAKKWRNFINIFQIIIMTGKNFRLHYVTARECVNIVLAAQDGVEGNPDFSGTTG